MSDDTPPVTPPQTWTDPAGRVWYRVTVIDDAGSRLWVLKRYSPKRGWVYQVEHEDLMDIRLPGQAAP